MATPQGGWGGFVFTGVGRAARRTDRNVPKPHGNSVVSVSPFSWVPSNMEIIHGSKSHVIGIFYYQTRKSRENLSPVGIMFH